MEYRDGGAPVPAAHLADGGDPFIFTTMRYDPTLVDSLQNTAVSGHKPCPFYMFEHHFTRIQVAKWSLVSWAEEALADDPSKFGGDGSEHIEARLKKLLSSPAELLVGLLNAVETWRRMHPDEPFESLRIKLRMYMSGKIRTEIFNPIPRQPIERLFPSSFPHPQRLLPTDWVITLDTAPAEPTERTMIKTSDRCIYDRARANVGMTSYAVREEVLLYTSQGVIFDGSFSTPYFFREGQWLTPESAVGGQQGVTRRWALAKGFCVEGAVHRDSVQPGEVILMSNAVRGYFACVFRPSIHHQ